MTSVDRILGESSAKMAKDPKWAYIHAKNFIKGRWPRGEAAIAKDPLYSYFYVQDVVKDRWPEGEAAIASNNDLAKRYLQKFPEAKQDWFLNGWLDFMEM